MEGSLHLEKRKDSGQAAHFYSFMPVWSSCLTGLRGQKTEFRVTTVAGKNKKHKLPVSGMTEMTPLLILQLL